jgi:predicted phage-related endonuclease
VSLTRAQLAFRRTGITATDVVVLAGLPYHGRTVHDVWREKVLGDTKLAETEAMSLGNELEPIVLRRAAAKRDLVIVPVAASKMTRAHPTKPTHLATPDAFVARRRRAPAEAILQGKVVGFDAARAWGPANDNDDGIPEEVLVQCAWELHVTGLPVDHVGALVGTEVRTYEVRADAPAIVELIGELEELADAFMRDHVTPRKPPELDGSDGAERMLRALFPKPRGIRRKAGPKTEALAAKYFAAKTALAANERELAELEQHMMLLCSDGEAIVGDGWRLEFKWREPYEVRAKAYTVKGHRHFDMRPIKAKGRVKVT